MSLECTTSEFLKQDHVICSSKHAGTWKSKESVWWRELLYIYIPEEALNLAFSH